MNENNILDVTENINNEIKNNDSCSVHERNTCISNVWIFSCNSSNFNKL